MSPKTEHQILQERGDASNAKLGDHNGLQVIQATLAYVIGGLTLQKAWH
jgi:hypothetical protein